jgi:arylsulfatase A-like enzyme
MNLKNITGYTILGIAALPFISFAARKEKVPIQLPNILWLVSEDNSPFLGCYGDEFSNTPNLDRFACQGFRYIHAYANAPVCAPARNTIITGVYANSNGHEHMRSFNPKSELLKTYPEFLREIGYYCTNNAKTDYNTNTIDPDKIWDECSSKAHYKNRAAGHPFFAVFNSFITHEGSIHKSIPTSELRHSPEKVPLPPYHPNTPELKHDWAQYYDKVEEMDAWIGEKLKELDDAGLAENTIVIYCADNGGVLARSKYFVYETGTRVPFIIRIPEKYKHLFPAKNPGATIDRLISFVDIEPTLLSMVGLPIPGYLQGHAFLGNQKTEDPEYAFMFRARIDERYDLTRAVRDKRFRYIRNYMPYRAYGQHMEDFMVAISARSWQQAYLNGACNKIQSVFWNTKPAEELYDTEKDPWEINNLASDPACKKVLERMRKTNSMWIRQIYDTGFIPEADLVDRIGNAPAYDYMRSGKINLNEIINAAEIATVGDVENLKTLQKYLQSRESAVRYWGATGLLILGDKAAPALNDLKAALYDESASVVTVAAEALYKLGEKDEAKRAFLRVLKSPNKFAQCYALNAMDCAEMGRSPEMIEGVVNVLKARVMMPEDRYLIVAAAKYLLGKWKVNPDDYQLKFD